MCRELKFVALWKPKGWVGEGDGREIQEEGDICMLMDYSCRCMAETHIILQNNYPPIKKKETDTE